ncbi:DUF2141 domain-containing protein [Halorhodospira halophila]|uniref:DUF2141 domain-containing protein n=1 Tax=Halorhodospira halophila TaxID=1053 RepID=UPI000673F1B6|nr:DUF2141 domain-containing protein [Halorhodospira halophila]MBK1729422.1 DUF2141 domain-containing protein [Halorhodospira halophila]
MRAITPAWQGPALRVAGCVALLMGISPAIAATLQLEILLPKAGQGSVYVAVFDDPEAFPDPDGALIRKARPVEGDAVALTISDLVPGEYAVAAFQDLDGSGDLTTNFLGIPREPAGFSRGAMGRMGPPDFADAAFTVDEEGTSVTLDLRD